MSNNVTNHEPVHGFKVFNPDWTCRNFQYEVGKTFEEDVNPSCCDRGFHFCEKAADCFNYYKFDSNNKVAEVIAYGEVRTDGDKSCTNKIHIVREIPWMELLTIVNTGKDNTGLGNTGDMNAGDCNTGSRNTGNRNTGNRNTGSRNTGDRNTGNMNSGSFNTGDFNNSSFNAGCFNVKEHKIMLFDKPSDMTYQDWLDSKARELLRQIPKSAAEWVNTDDMTDEEKVAHSTYKTTGGYLKELDKSECCQMWWDSLDIDDKEIIKAIPNFDPDIFYECAGIRVD